MLFTSNMFSQSIELKSIYKNSASKKTDSTSILLFNKNKTSIKNITDSLIFKLQKKGYLNILYTKPKKITDNTYYLNIILNKRYTHIKINHVTKTKQDSLIYISLSRKREQIVTIESQEQYLNDYNNDLKEKGFPFNEVKLSKVILSKKDTLEAELTFITKKKRYIDQIIIKGYTDFPKRIINQNINRKKSYSENSINDIDKIISNIPFAKATKKTEILFKKDSTNVYLYLEKIKTNTADGLIGFNNSTNGKLELNGYINLKLQNNLNKAETFSLEYRNDNGDQTKLNTYIDLPYIWNSPLGLNTELEIQRRDSTYQRTSFTSGIFYKPNWKTSIGLNYKTTSSTATDALLGIEDFTKRGIEGSVSFIEYNTDVLMPENFYLKGTLGFSNRNGIEKTEKQLNFNATFLKLWHLTNRSKFLNKIMSYYLKSNDIQFNELYQFGGLGSIRGFNQNSIDSSFYTTIATEYRYRLNDQIYLHSILDIGVFENFNSKKLDKLYGFGGGIAILTQAGILNLSIANGRFEDAKVDLSSTVAHINLIINF